MSHVVASSAPITSAHTVKQYAGFGILGADIPTTGDNGGSPVINDGITSTSEYHWRVSTAPSDGVLTIYSDMSFLFDATGLDSGSYPWAYRLYEDGIDQGTSTVTITVGGSSSSHSASGALTAQGSTASGSTSRFHAFSASGGLTGAGSGLSATATRTRLFNAFGSLSGANSSVTGSAQKNILHATSGVLAGQVSAISGEAGRSAGAVTHPSTGVLAGSGAAISGASARSRSFASTGTLTGAGSVVSGASARVREFGATGTLAGSGATISGASSRVHVFGSSGTLSGAGSMVSGSAARSGVAVTHSATGTLVGSGAVVSGLASGPSVTGMGGRRFKRKRVFIDGQEYFLNPMEAANLLIERAAQAAQDVEENDEKVCSLEAETPPAPIPTIDYAALKASSVKASQVFIDRMNAEIERMQALELQRYLDEEDDIACLMLLL